MKTQRTEKVYTCKFTRGLDESMRKAISVNKNHMGPIEEYDSKSKSPKRMRSPKPSAPRREAVTPGRTI